MSKRKVLRTYPSFSSGKWLFTLNEQQVDARRRGLEHYLEKVCAIRVIADSDIVQEFLTDANDPTRAPVANVDLKILLPDQKIVGLSVKKVATADDVYRAVLREIGMSPDTARFFALYELIEYCFGKFFYSRQFSLVFHICVYLFCREEVAGERVSAFNLHSEL